MSSAPIRLHVPPPFELWLVSLASPAGGADFDLLDDAERARSARFHFERDRGRYVAAHAALRRLLAQRTSRDPAALVIEAGPHGKPDLAGTSRCAFSLSHCEDLALVALADDGEIGVDLERVRPLADLDGLARQCLTLHERHEIDLLAPGDRSLAFLRRWTRKEACLKALGAGLHIEPSSFAVDGGGTAERVCIPTISGPCDVQVQDVDVRPGWVGALARVLTSH
jgi:4'-phosphopantetheinyl transferase